MINPSPCSRSPFRRTPGRQPPCVRARMRRYRVQAARLRPQPGLAEVQELGGAGGPAGGRRGVGKAVTEDRQTFTVYQLTLGGHQIGEPLAVFSPIEQAHSYFPFVRLLIWASIKA